MAQLLSTNVTGNLSVTGTTVTTKIIASNVPTFNFENGVLTITVEAE